MLAVVGVATPEAQGQGVGDGGFGPSGAGAGVGTGFADDGGRLWESMRQP